MEADITLLAAARKMDGEALIRIFDLYSPALYKYAFRLCNNAVMADQIVGDVFAKLVAHLSAGAGPRTNLRSYLFEMAHHLIVDAARYSHRWAPIEVVSSTRTDDSSTSATAKDRMLLEALLRAILHDLTEDQRHVIFLRFMEGFSIKETALIVGKKVGNVKVIQNRAIAALRKALDYQIVETRAITLTIRSMSQT